METRQRKTQLSNSVQALHSNDNHIPALATGRSVFPQEAVARIYRPVRSAVTSRPAPKQWLLEFEQRCPSYIEPLMGYTGCNDTLKQVQLRFPTKDTAVRYAQRQGLNYVVSVNAGPQAKPSRRRPAQRRFTNETLERLGLFELTDSYRYAMSQSANQNYPEAHEDWANPIEVVRHRDLSLAFKRSILMNWAWKEYLADQATNEGMPENGCQSRLAEVERALLALERNDESSSNISDLEPKVA